MEFLDSIIDILFVIGAIALGFLPGIKKLLGGAEEAKKIVRPIRREVSEGKESPQSQKRKAQSAAPQQPQNEEYFSYETMSDRDFENLFIQNNEETVTTTTDTTIKNIHLTMNEEEVYKGIVWSEILKRKY